jgi:RNA polymerase sigma factor (sigma-70 family)
LSIAFDSRPDRSQIDPVALDLIERRGPEVLGVARRYAVSPEDAEDAYQRALEILLTKAPSTSEAQLLPWLKTVVKHEAFALRKKRERDVPAEHDALDAFADEVAAAAEDRAERYDRLRVGAEALGRLKPQETKCLLLKAEGLSYQEIAARTGWSYTKVNRCLVEGRRAFVARVQGIESGAECQRIAPLLSALADGEASAEDMAALRPHLRGCSSCRATLRDYREAPQRVAALPLPLAGGGALAWFGDRVVDAVAWVKSCFEAKVAVVAASTVAVAGGGAVGAKAIDHHPPPQRAAGAVVSRPAPAKPPVRVAPVRLVRGAGSAAAARPRRAPKGEPAGVIHPAPPPAATKPEPSSAPPSAPSTPVPGKHAAASPTAEPAPAATADDPGEFGP